MRTIATSAGPIDLHEVGSGPELLLLAGSFMDHRLWAPVVDRLAADHRCLVPVLPLGAHRIAMDPAADLTPSGVARLVTELVETLDLHEPTLVGNDTGGALAQLSVVARPDLFGALVLTSCDAFDNFPPGLPGRTSSLAARLPGGLWSAAQAMRFRPMMRLPLTWGRMTARPVPAELIRDWFSGMRRDGRIRADARRFLKAVSPDVTGAAARQLPEVTLPSLILWSREDRVMPPAHAERLAELLPNSRLQWIPDAGTLAPLDRPDLLAQALRDFVAETSGSGSVRRSVRRPAVVLEQQSADAHQQEPAADDQHPDHPEGDRHRRERR